MLPTPPAGLARLTTDQNPPGRWLSGNGAESWEGEPHWLVTAGESLLLSSYGRYVAGWDVALPDGRRGTAELVGADCWRLWAAGRAVLGAISVEAGDCVLHPNDSPPYRPSSAFEAALWADVDFRALVRRPPFIGAACAYVASRAFRPDGADAGRFMMTLSEVAAMFSRMRGWGDAVVDVTRPAFAFEPQHTVLFEEILENAGWHALTPEEYALDHARALRLLDEVEAVPLASVAPSERPQVMPIAAFDPEGGAVGPVARMQRAVADARCDAEVYRTFMSLLDIGDERLHADLNALRSP